MSKNSSTECKNPIWKGSVLDYCSTMSSKQARKLEKGELTLQDIYPLHSSWYRRCEKHRR